MLNSRSSALRMLPLLPIKAVLMPEVFVMAIEDYVRSIAVKDSVSKDQVFRYLEMQFARADRNHDGKLDIDELRSFVGAISLPETDQR
jgi:EF hand